MAYYYDIYNDRMAVSFILKIINILKEQACECTIVLVFRYCGDVFKNPLSGIYCCYPVIGIDPSAFLSH